MPELFNVELDIIFDNAAELVSFWQDNVSVCGFFFFFLWNLAVYLLLFYKHFVAASEVLGQQRMFCSVTEENV